jgi:hypothetical protein
MSAPRRQIIRPSIAPDNARRQQRLQRLRTKLDKERETLARWQKRLRRAFNTVERQQGRIARLERQLQITEENGHA